MRDEEALELATLVGELWPGTPLTGIRREMYARALRSVPEQAAALRAIDYLFAVERWQPPPAAIVDRATGMDEALAGAWRGVVDAAIAMQAGRALEPETRPGPQPLAALRHCGFTLRDLPVNDAWRLDKVRTRFAERLRSMMHEEATRALGPAKQAALKAVGGGSR